MYFASVNDETSIEKLVECNEINVREFRRSIDHKV